MIGETGTSRGEKARKGREAIAKPSLLYAALHTTNLGLCLAAGVLSPRYETSAAADHHRHSGGRIILTKAPVNPSLLVAARGQIHYGQVALVEIETTAVPGKTKNKNNWEVVAPLPLALVKRIIFRTTGEKEEFLIRLAGYADTPTNVIEIAVDESLFGSVGNAKPKAQSAAGSGDIFSIEEGLRTFDRIGGALAAGLDVVRRHSFEPMLLESIEAACEAASETGDLQVLFSTLSNRFEPGAARQLAPTVIRVLSRQDRSTTINADRFLGDICSPPAWEGEKVDEEVTKFRQHASDVIGLRREIADDAFADIPGKIVPRATLLFLLNPTVEKMAAATKQGKFIGRKVHLIAAMLAGYLSGFMKLPVAIKAPTREQFLVTGILSNGVWCREPVEFSRAEEWHADGSRHLAISVDGIVLLTSLQPASTKLEQVRAIAKRLGFSPIYDEKTGKLDFGTSGIANFGDISASESLTPTIPKQEAVEIIVDVTRQIAVKEFASIAKEVNTAARDTGIFANTDSKDKGKRLQFVVLCPSNLMSEEFIKEALHVLESQAKRFIR